MIPAGGGRRDGGAALPLTLLVVAVLGLLALTLAFTATLDDLAARSALESVRAGAQAEGALAQAAAAVGSLTTPALRTGVRLGPWTAAGIEGTADVVADADGVVWITARATVGRSETVRTVVVAGLATGTPRVLMRP